MLRLGVKSPAAAMPGSSRFRAILGHSFSLEVLFVNATNITDEGLLAVGSLPLLKELWLYVQLHGYHNEQLNPFPLPMCIARLPFSGYVLQNAHRSE